MAAEATATAKALAATVSDRWLDRGQGLGSTSLNACDQANDSRRRQFGSRQFGASLSKFEFAATSQAITKTTTTSRQVAIGVNQM